MTCADARHMYVVFTSFNESMLELDGPTGGLASFALDMVRLHSIPLILATDGTAAEAQMLRIKHLNAHPFNIENRAPPGA